MKIAWKETVDKMRRMGYNEAEIEKMKRDPIDAVCRFIDQGREVSLFFKHKGALIQLEGETALKQLRK